MRLICGTLRSTPLPWLPVLSNIEPPALRRKAATDKLVEKIVKHDSWSIQPISLAHHCYDWRTDIQEAVVASQLTSKVDWGITVTPQSTNWILTSLGNSGLCWTVLAWNRNTAVPAEGNGDLQTLIYVLVARLTLSNPVPWQNWMAAYLGYTLWMKTLFRDWPVMAHETHTRRRSGTSGISHCVIAP